MSSLPRSLWVSGSEIELFHEVLREVESVVPYCTVRSGNDTVRRRANLYELDILVAGDLERLRATLARVDFLPMAEGDWPHNFFGRYCSVGGHWLKLDVVVAICFGHPLRFLPLAPAEELLSRRVNRDGIYSLSPGDEIQKRIYSALLNQSHVGLVDGLELSRLSAERSGMPLPDETRIQSGGAPSRLRSRARLTLLARAPLASLINLLRAAYRKGSLKTQGYFHRDRSHA